MDDVVGREKSQVLHNSATILTEYLREASWFPSSSRQRVHSPPKTPRTLLCLNRTTIGLYELVSSCH